MCITNSRATKKIKSIIDILRVEIKLNHIKCLTKIREGKIRGEFFLNATNKKVKHGIYQSDHINNYFIKLKVKEWRHTYHANTNQSKAGVAVFILDKADLRTRKILKIKVLHIGKRVNSPRKYHLKCVCT